MKVRATIRKKGEVETWTEVFTVTDEDDSALAIINRFNASLKPGEKARELVSSQILEVSPRSDVELFLCGTNDFSVIKVEEMLDVIDEPSQALLLFLQAAPIGSMYCMSCEGTHFSYGALVTPGQGKQYGLLFEGGFR